MKFSLYVAALCGAFLLSSSAMAQSASAQSASAQSPNPLESLPEAPLFPTAETAPPNKNSSRPPLSTQRISLEDEEETESDQQLVLPPENETAIDVMPVPPSTQVRTQKPQKGELARPGETLRAVAGRLKIALPLKNGEVRIYKAQRRLEVWNGKQLLKTYIVALGANPSGHKSRRGDSKTPEGRYYICTRNTQTSAFHIFLGLSYPALPDAARAASKRRISWREYAAIRSRLASRSAPLWRTRLGGWVGIHGGSDGAFAARQRNRRGTSDWTAGCIALTNREIEDVAAAVKIGTPVLVRP